KISTNGGIGNDWGVFAVFDNPNTGLQPMVAQGAAFIMAQYLDPDSIRITGYGVDDGAANQTQQTHVGPDWGSSGTTMRYRTDTMGGNSGSPVIDDSTGYALGVHTHGGCNSTGGNNNGTSTFHPDFWAQVSAAAGIPPVPPSNLSSYSNYSTPTSIQLSWEDPAYLVNGDTLLSSDFSIHIKRDGAWIDSVLGGTGQYVDSGLNDGQLYEYTIFARLDSLKWESEILETSWIAGGSPIPDPPLNLGINTGVNEVLLSWVNPTTNIDGTPLDDFEAINIYLDSVLVSMLTRTSADTSKLDSFIYSISGGEFHSWHLTALDNETPQNESVASNVVITPLNLPKLDYFQSSGLPDSTIWRSMDTDINDRSLDPPSGPYALNLNGKPNGTDSLELYPTDLSGYTGSGLLFSYYYQPQGQGNSPEPGDSLKVEFLNSMGEWILVRNYEGSTVQAFTQEQIDMENEPSGSGTFLHSQFQLRISSRGLPSVFTPNDDWFVDNIYLGLPVGVGLVSHDSLFFDTTQVGSSSSQDMWVTNQGFDSLEVSDILVTNSVFSVNPGNFVLGIGDSVMLQVGFTPLQGGTESGLLQILGNGVVDTLDVYVEGIGEGLTGIVGDESLPRRFELRQNYPNPFNPVTLIHYELPRGSEVSLTVYNLLGQKVRSLVSGYQGAGRYDVEWRGDNDLGH
ncbi:MAG: hypothetical protein KAJ16_03025, partial [Calditrichia bacterium]|nr:hypothetical protein [Calditrichia bacterium]